MPDSDPGDGAFVAEAQGEIAGFAQVDPPAWNGRAAVLHLYVSAPYRGRGLGMPSQTPSPSTPAPPAPAACGWRRRT